MNETTLPITELKETFQDAIANGLVNAGIGISQRAAPRLEGKDIVAG